MEMKCIPSMCCGETFADLYRFSKDKLPMEIRAIAENSRSKDPFGIKFPKRLTWTSVMPSLHEYAYKYVHPDFNRPISLHEYLTITGRDSLPKGDNPFAQIAYCTPAKVAAWLAINCKAYFDDHWGREDFQTHYDPQEEKWKGGNVTDKTQPKRFEMFRYIDYSWDEERYPRPFQQKVRRYLGDFY
jgi:hypothetical protein